MTMHARRANRTYGLSPLVLAGALLAACSPSPPPNPGLAVAALMGAAPPEGFAQAIEPREFRFPTDHGPHAEFRTEWWYGTGNLEDPNGRRYGYQLTLFRNALNPADEVLDTRPEAFATREAWMGHLALSDPQAGRFHAFERFARGAAGLAGAEQRDGLTEVWLEDWRIEIEGAESPRLSLSARDSGFGLDLALEAIKPLVLQGDNGLSIKGPQTGDASYYYSLTRLEGTGTLRLGGDPIPVTGRGWFDREWSTSALGADQVGWDWFALQLDDGRDLMAYSMRLAGGGTDRTSHGLLVAADGSSRHLSADDFEIEVAKRWTSPRSGADYPTAWTLRLPAEQLELTVEAAQPDQELPVSVRYWEGAVDVSGTSKSTQVAGRGYVELTGYDR